jgi:hypothetical protein
MKRPRWCATTTGASTRSEPLNSHEERNLVMRHEPIGSCPPLKPSLTSAAGSPGLSSPGRLVSAGTYLSAGFWAPADAATRGRPSLSAAPRPTHREESLSDA